MKTKFILLDSAGIGYCSGSGAEFMFDLEDYEKIKKFEWCLRKSKYGNYIHARINNKWTYMHRFVMDAPKNQTIDHIDRNTVNNQKINLRFVTVGENSRNHKQRKNSNNKIIGVCYSKRDKLWIPNIRINGKRVCVGWFKNEEDAIVARLNAEKKYYGVFAPQYHLFEEYGIQ